MFLAGEGWAVGASVLTGSQASAQECGQQGRRHVGIGQLALSQHWARGDRPEGNSTTIELWGLGELRHFLGKSKEDEVGRLEMLWVEGIGGASSRTL